MDETKANAVLSGAYSIRKHLAANIIQDAWDAYDFLATNKRLDSRMEPHLFWAGFFFSARGRLGA